MSSGKEKQQTGRCGELLVQARLLRHGIESAPMTNDYGIDLIALRVERDGKVTPVSIQVKTNATPWKQGKSEGYYWDFPQQSPADFIAFVAIDKSKGNERELIWLHKYAEVDPKPKQWFTIYTNKGSKGRWTIQNSKPHLLENMVGKLFPPQK